MELATFAALNANCVSNVCEVVVSIAVVAVLVKPATALVVDVKAKNVPLEMAVPLAPAVMIDKKPLHEKGIVDKMTPFDELDVPYTVTPSRRLRNENVEAPFVETVPKISNRILDPAISRFAGIVNETVPAG